MDPFGLVTMFLLGYFVPSAVAAFRKHKNATAIFVLNLLLGWTVIGWVVAIVWALTNPAPAQVVLTPGAARACLKCGMGYDAGAKFCPSCGAPAPGTQERVESLTP